MVEVRSPLSKNDRAKFNSVLIIDVHARDIIDSFVRDRFVRIEQTLLDSFPAIIIYRRKTSLMHVIFTILLWCCIV